MKRRIANIRFQVDVYTVEFGAITYLYTRKGSALKFAQRSFKIDAVYKVKVWDLQKGRPVRNADIHPALILHLV